MSKRPYLFRDLETDELVELELTLDQILGMDILQTIKNKGKLYKRVNESDRAEATESSKVGNLAFNRPLRSRSAGVHSSQAGEFNEAARADGNAGVYYDTKTGEAHFDSRGARRRELARRGLRDLDGGYGDG